MVCPAVDLLVLVKGLLLLIITSLRKCFVVAVSCNLTLMVLTKFHVYKSIKTNCWDNNCGLVGPSGGFSKCTSVCWRLLRCWHYAFVSSASLLQSLRRVQQFKTWLVWSSCNSLFSINDRLYSSPGTNIEHCQISLRWNCLICSALFIYLHLPPPRSTSLRVLDKTGNLSTTWAGWSVPCPLGISSFVCASYVCFSRCLLISSIPSPASVWTSYWFDCHVACRLPHQFSDFPSPVSFANVIIVQCCSSQFPMHFVGFLFLPR